MEKVVQVRLDNDYLNKLNYIKKFFSNVCLQKEELTTSFLLKYCINSAYQNVTKIVNEDIDYYKEKGL